MFDIGFLELVLLLSISLLVLGPEKLAQTIRLVRKVFTSVKRNSNELLCGLEPKAPSDDIHISSNIQADDQVMSASIKRQATNAD